MKLHTQEVVDSARKLGLKLEVKPSPIKQSVRYLEQNGFVIHKLGRTMYDVIKRGTQEVTA